MSKILSTPFWSLLLLLAGISWNAPEMQAQAITFSYIFDGQVLTGTSTQPGATANNATYGAGLGTKTFFTGNPGDAVAGDGFASGTPLNPANNDYFGFSFTASACSTVTLTSLSFDARRSGTGPANLEIRYSANGFASTLFSGTLSGTNFESKTGSLANLVIAAGQTVEFRLYGFNATGTTGTLRVDNVRFNGTIAPAGPTAFAVTGGGAICPPAGAPVGLAGSQTTVNYQLKFNGSSIGAPVAGTGGAISFGDQTGLGTYTVVATNANSCTANQTGSAVISQSANCGGCSIALNTTQVNVLCNGNSTGSIDLTPSGGTPAYTYAWAHGPTSQDLSNLTAGTYTVTVSDAGGCTKTTSATITQPSAISLSTTQTNASCSALGSIDLTPGGGTPAYTYLWSNGATTQDVSNLAAGTYTVTVTDANGCTKTSSAIITQPTALSLNSTVVNPSNCFVANGSIDLSVSGGTAGYTYDWSNDGPESPDNDTQDLLNLSEGTFTVTVTDAGGCTATHTKTLDYLDLAKPLITCPANATIAAGAECSSAIGAYSPAAVSDNCTANPGVVQSPVSSTIINGANPSQLITLTATDEAGNTQSCTFTVSLVDLTAPTISCPGNQIVSANAGCEATLGNWSPVSMSDNCGASASVVQSPVSSTVLHGHNDVRMITLTATDAAGNSQSCSFTVTLRDVTSPSISCPANVTINADENCSGLTGAYSPVALSDNCTANPAVTQSPASSTALNGHNTSSIVTLTATDEAGNTQTCTLTVTLKDVTPPTLVCQPFVADLNAAGMVSIAPSDIYQSVSDNCSAVIVHPVVPNTFNCSNIGANLVTLTANDVNGNKALCTSIVTVRDVLVPVAKCKDITANLGINGTVTIAPPAVDNGSTDNCTFTRTLVPATFDCTNIGLNTITLQVTDASGNSATCQATVNVQDATGPTAKCKNTTIYLNDAGQATLSVAEVNNGSSDACGIANMSINMTQFNCSELPGSSWPVILSLTDVHGNTSSCLANVSVRDAIAPTAICENVTIAIGPNGKATVYGEDLASNSFDNCSVWSYSPIAKIYTAANLGPNNLTVTVKDWSGNASTCVSVVTVVPFGGGFQPVGGNAGIFDFAVYPNPAGTKATVAFQLPAEQTFALRIFDTAGRMVYSQQDRGIEGENSMPLQLEGLAPGVYLIDFQSENWNVQKRLMVQE